MNLKLFVYSNTMRKLLLLLILIIFLMPNAFATKGVGIVWTLESAEIPSDDVSCLSYGVYNPFDDDVSASLFVEGELEEISTNSEAKLVESGTSHDEAVSLDLCFDTSEVYEGDCILGFFCEQTCDFEDKRYSGDVVVKEIKDTAIGKITGSATTAMASVPLTLKVKCQKQERSMILLYAFAGLIIMFIAGSFIIFNKPGRDDKPASVEKKFEPPTYPDYPPQIEQRQEKISGFEDLKKEIEGLKRE
jgi:hypothetical protein